MKAFFKKFLKVWLVHSWQEGYSLIEITLVGAFIALLVGLATLNLFKFQHTSQLSATVNSFLADFKEQQLRAMYGDTNGTGTEANYGVYFGSTSYTEFQNTYGTANFTVSLPSGTQISTTFPNSQVIYLKGSGEVSGFTNGQNTITLKDTIDGSQKIITVNRYGVVTSVN